ncbi:MAG: aryl-sulfate sulfotransferase [Deltaproteobacteria bacterium]|nr:aryl-sulfate sulfotransferase [Deltaproteobacteria bacterium]
MSNPRLILIFFKTMLLLLAVFTCASCQEGTNGGVDGDIVVNSENRAEGYTLFSSTRLNTRATLVDMNGNVVHQWSVGGFPVTMTEIGTLIGSEGRYGDTQGCRTLIRELWDGTRTWSFSNWYEEDNEWYARQHHGMVLEGNPVGYYAPGQSFEEEGRLLVLAHQNVSAPEIHPDELRDDVIYEVQSNGQIGDFFWLASDHIDEFGFTDKIRNAIFTASHKGSVLEWLHSNSIARVGKNRHFDAGDDRFNPQNIIWSSRRTNVIAIIAPETGQIVWRIGPIFADAAEAGLGQFIGQHFPHMIPAGLPGEGNMLVFDNGGESGYESATDDGYQFAFKRSYSRVVEFDPITFELVWEYGPQSGEDFFFSKYTSSAQRLPNGNTLIAIGDKGEIREVTPNKETVWRYIAPGKTAINAIYRAYRIPPEWLPKEAGTATYPFWRTRYQ